MDNTKKIQNNIIKNLGNLFKPMDTYFVWNINNPEFFEAFFRQPKGRTANMVIGCLDEKMRYLGTACKATLSVMDFEIWLKGPALRLVQGSEYIVLHFDKHQVAHCQVDTEALEKAFDIQKKGLLFNYSEAPIIRISPSLGDAVS